MNIKEYIASGILADYCLQLLTEEEKKEVESFCEVYPEVANELKLLTITLEKYLISKNNWRKAELRSAILEAIKKLREEL